MDKSDRQEEVLASVLDRREERDARRREQPAELRMRIEDTKIRLALRQRGGRRARSEGTGSAKRMADLCGIHDQTQVDTERIEAMLKNVGETAISPTTVRRLAAIRRMGSVRRFAIGQVTKPRIPVDLQGRHWRTVLETQPNRPTGGRMRSIGGAS